MISVDYDEIFGSFLGSVTDYKLASLKPTEAYQLLTELLHKVLAERYVARLFTTKTLDDEIHKFNFEMKYVIDDDSDKEFVITALSKWMVYEWHANKANNIVLESQLFAGKEQKYYSQSAHMDSVKALRDSSYQEAYKFVMSRGYIDNKYLGGQ